MPPKYKFDRETVIQAAFELAREEGVEAVTARRLGAKLGASTKPIFGLFEGMGEVIDGVREEAEKLYQSYIQNEKTWQYASPYMVRGMAYIRFAKEEEELFKLLFMNRHTDTTIEDERETHKSMIDSLQQSMGLSKKEAFQFHVEMQAYIHGIAAMFATAYLDWDLDFVGEALADGYIGLKYRYFGGRS